jgi:polysaccharide export outer membrane protein
MKRFFLFIGPIVAMLWVLQVCMAAFAQTEKAKDLGETKESFRSGLTGAGAGDSETTAAKPGGADGQENPLLGGTRRPLYRLRPSDVVDVSFTVSPEFDQSLRVQPDGYVWLKDAGMVSAEGLTLEEFADAVRRSYQGYLHDPQVAVALKDFERPSFIVGGEVSRPGKYELRTDTTVTEAVELAGGLTMQAKHSQVVLFRRVNDDLVETRLLNLKKMLRAKNLGEDAHVHPGDLIYVPQNAISKIARFLTRPSVSMYMNSSQF